MKLDPHTPASLPEGRIDKRRLNKTTEHDITLQQHADHMKALQDAARFSRRVRRCLGLTQLEFSLRIDVSLDTIPNREQGKRRPPAQQKPCPKCWTRPRKPPCRFLADSENRRADLKAGDLKHVVASLLPAPIYRNLVDFVTHRRSARFGGCAEPLKFAARMREDANCGRLAPGRMGRPSGAVVGQGHHSYSSPAQCEGSQSPGTPLAATFSNYNVRP